MTPERPGALRWFMVVGSASAGAVCWLLDLGLLWILVVLGDLGTAPAAALAFIAAGIVNFMLNRLIFTDRGQRRERRQALRYLALTVVNVLLVSVLVPAGERGIDMVLDDRGLALILAKVAVTAALLLPNALAYRRWVFAEPSGPRPE